MSKTENLDKKPIQAPWYGEIPEGDFVSTAPTYEAGKYFSLFHEGKYTYGDVTMKYY